MTDNRIVMADAGLISEFANARRAGLPGDVVERRARQIEEKGVKRLVDHVARIALEVVQKNFNGGGIGLYDAPAALPAFAIRVVAKFDADEIGIVGRKRAAETGQGIVIPRFDHRELGSAQRARDQRGRVLQIQGLPELLSEDSG